MRTRPVPEAGGAREASRTGRRFRRVRALFRLHRKTLVTAAVAVGILLMILHWH